MDVCKFWIASLCVAKEALANQSRNVCHVYVGGGFFYAFLFFIL